jgi:enoyl-CoA hydratase/3-hydroxyacyl-CoA dehydrogenase
VGIAWLKAKPVNPISEELVRDLGLVYDRAEADPEIKSLVIASANTAIFSAGANLKAFAAFGPDDVAKAIDATNALFRKIETGRLTTIAAVNGGAFGGGCELSMSANVRLAGESATFGQPEINLGIVPGFGGSQRLPRLVGKAAAFEIITSGDSISAWRALEIGLVSDVLPDHELFDAAIALGEELAAQPQAAIAQIKGLLDDPTLEAAIQRERDAFVAAVDSPDGREGVAAFLQKRAPKFTQ